MTNYLRLDDSVLNTYFNYWSASNDKVLADLAKRFLNRHPFKSVVVPAADGQIITAAINHMTNLVKQAGYNPTYYTAINDSFDLPYDAYAPESKKATRIELIQKNGSTKELSQISSLVQALKGRQMGDKRFFFPKEMLGKNPQLQIFNPIFEEFCDGITNDIITLDDY